MINIVATLGQSLFSGFCMLILASLVCSLFYPTYLTLSGKLSVENQAFTSLCYALIAPLSAFLGVVVLIHPAIAATVVYAHCHGSNCQPHAPASITTSLTGASLVALVALTSVLLLYFMLKKVQQARAKHMFLDTLAGPEKALPTVSPLTYKLIESEDLLAWCAGLFFPRVYISSGLVQKLSTLQLNAVLAHEYGHVLRRDNLRKLLLSWSSSLWLPKHRDAVRRNFTAQTEQLSDIYSATITGQSELIKNTYAMFSSPQQTSPSSFYQHRHLTAADEMNLVVVGVLPTIAIYIILAVLFVGLTIVLTMAAHGLLENL